MTGRAAGYCAGYPAPGFMNPIPGRGFGGGGRGFGRGWGRGWGGRFRGFGAAPYSGVPYGAPYTAAPNVAPYGYAVPYAAAPSPQQEADALKGQAEYLDDALAGIRKRLAELEAEQAENK